MSILNPITEGGGGSWKEVANTSASATAVSFPVSHEPQAWFLFRVTNTTATVIYYIDEDNGTHREWGLSVNYLRQGGTPTGSYSNGVFTVTSGSYSFSTTVGDYVLIYI